MASERGHLQVVVALLKDPRVDPSAGDQYALRHALDQRHFEVAERLLQDFRIDPTYDQFAIVRLVREILVNMIKYVSSLMYKGIR